MKTTRTTKLLCEIALITAIATGLASGQSVINGSFESGIDANMGTGVSTPLAAVDSTSITGWTVSAGSIDYIGLRWMAADGSRNIDLSGVGTGTITQVVTGFSVGQRSRLSFYMAANPEQPQFHPAIRSLTASIGATSQNFSFAVDSHTATSMGWTLETMDFTASASSLTLSFASLTADAAGPALDAISISQVPEPNVLAMLGIAAFAATAYRVRRVRAA